MRDDTFLARLLFVAIIISACSTAPVHTNEGTSDTPQSPSSKHHQFLAEHHSIPPLSHYTVSKFNRNVEGRYEQVQDPLWDSYEFHMIKDHPINAKEHRKLLDEQLKDGHISVEKHESETSNSRHREQAVNHIIYGGIVQENGNDVFIHGRHSVPTSSIFDHIKARNIAFFFDWKTAGVGRQYFENTGSHVNHLAREEERQRSRIDEIQEMARNLGLGKQVDAEHFEHAHHLPKSKATPPPSPPHSPKSPPRQQGKDAVFGHKAWQ